MIEKNKQKLTDEELKQVGGGGDSKDNYFLKGDGGPDASGRVACTNYGKKCEECYQVVLNYCVNGRCIPGNG